MPAFKKPSIVNALFAEAGRCARTSELLAPGAIKVNMQAADKEAAFEELVDLLVQTGGVSDREAALAAVRKREAMGSTCVGEGIAVPHGKDKRIRELVASLGLSREGIPFGGADGKPAKVIFLLLARANTPGPHVRALASFAQLTQSPRFACRMLEGKSAAEVLEAIREAESLL